MYIVRTPQTLPDAFLAVVEARSVPESGPRPCR